MWTALAVEPITVRLAPWIARRRRATPNRITALAAVLGVLSAVGFLRGFLILGGILFQLRYVADCLDGKVARLRGLSSARGGALDLMVDVTTIALNYTALCWFLTRYRGAPTSLGLYVVVTSMLWAWMLAYRKDIERQLGAAGAPDGTPRQRGAETVSRRRALAGRYRDFMVRHRSMPVPYAVEAETAGLSFGPIAAALLGASVVAVASLWVVVLFYVLASVVNAHRIWRLAGQIDGLKQSAVAVGGAGAVAPQPPISIDLRSGVERLLEGSERHLLPDHAVGSSLEA